MSPEKSKRTIRTGVRFVLLVVLAAAWGTAPTPSLAARIPCTEAALLNEIIQANIAGGGTITFNCTNTTILVTQTLGEVQDSVIFDGENRNITIEYTQDFTGCTPSNSAPRIARVRGRNNVFRNLTFKNFLESIQLEGPNNLVENCTFLAHPSCSDDAVSTTQPTATNTIIRNNRMQDYQDKAIQMSFGAGIIEGNDFVDSNQPIRGPFGNAGGGSIFFIRDNLFRTSTADRSPCFGPRFDGAYVIFFERNTLQCLRGLRVAGTTQIVVDDNFIEGNDRHGIQIRGSAIVSISRNRILANGLNAGSEPAGGVVVEETGQADLGGGSLVINGQPVTSPGGNVLQGNGVADLRNLRSGYLVKAENDCWDGATAAAILASDVQGSVDFDPFSSGAAAEVCDGVDNDCDGLVDEEGPPPPAGVTVSP
jgi:hypothetical protein